jgi:hypothetical protein
LQPPDSESHQKPVLFLKTRKRAFRQQRLREWPRLEFLPLSRGRDWVKKLVASVALRGKAEKMLA